MKGKKTMENIIWNKIKITEQSLKSNLDFKVIKTVKNIE